MIRSPRSAVHLLRLQGLPGLWPQSSCWWLSPQSWFWGFPDLKTALQVILMHLLIKRPPTWSYSLPFTDEKLVPKLTVTWWQGALLAETPLWGIPLFSFIGTGRRPLSDSPGLSWHHFLCLSSQGLLMVSPPPPQWVAVVYATWNLFGKLHQEPPPLLLSVYRHLSSQGWIGGSRLIQSIPFLWPLWLAQGWARGQVRTLESNRLALGVPRRRPLCPFFFFFAGLDSTGSRVAEVIRESGAWKWRERNWVRRT